MTQEEYETKKRECWEEFKVLNSTTLETTNQAFDWIWNRAYALGKETETITQEEIENEAEEYAIQKTEQYIPVSYGDMRHRRVAERFDSYDIEQAFEDGANYALGKQETKQETDAEEEEMLICERSKVQTFYKDVYECLQNAIKELGDHNMYTMQFRGILCSIKELFGTKCLPDETGNVASSDVASNVASSKPKPAEPKYNKDDKVRTIKVMSKDYVGKVGTINRQDDGGYIVDYDDGSHVWSTESDLRPYTESKEEYNSDNTVQKLANVNSNAQTCTDDCPSQSKSQYLNLSQTMSKCDKSADNTLTDRTNNRQDHFGENSEMVDNIIKDSFRNHNRLHIAALAMQGLLFDGMRDPDTVAEVAFEYADALIRKSKKGGDDGKD